MINGVHHVSLSTTDMDRLLAFYRDLLGLEQRLDTHIPAGNLPFETVVGMPGASARAAGLRAGNLLLELFEYDHVSPKPVEQGPASDAGIRHICFDVTDIDAEVARLKEAGVRFVSDPQDVSPTIRSVYARDPDGNIVEFQEIFPGSPLERGHVHR
jgi:catechol 2,3-dioxygenase-like lactoylglutathione lyase family enzyme